MTYALRPSEIVLVEEPHVVVRVTLCQPAHFLEPSANLDLA